MTRILPRLVSTTKGDPYAFLFKKKKKKAPSLAMTNAGPTQQGLREQDRILLRRDYNRIQNTHKATFITKQKSAKTRI